MVNSTHAFERTLQTCLQGKGSSTWDDESDSTRVDLDLSAFTSVSPPFYSFKSSGHRKACENTINMGAPGRSTLQKGTT